MDELDFYGRHSPLTDPGHARSVLKDLPSDVVDLGKIIEGVLVHRDETRRIFDFALPESRRDEANTRRLSAILDRLGTLAARPPAQRFAGTCRDFSVLLCGMLREQRIPARVRCGFAGYFADGFFDDHWVVEVWDGRWRLVDAQVLASPPGSYRADLDARDVPRDAFLVAGDAWLDCRAGRRDPRRIGTSAAGLVGLWEIQGSVVRDLANLNRVETLPWDNWGPISTHFDDLDAADVELLDRVAAVSAGGGPLARAVEIYAEQPRLRVPEELAH